MDQRFEDRQELEERERTSQSEEPQRTNDCLQPQPRVTEEEQVNLALKKSEEDYRTLLENIDIGIFRTLPNGARPIVKANPAMARIFGYGSLAEFLTMPPLAMYADPEERDAVIAAVIEQGVVRDLEVRMRRRDGRAILCSLTCTAVRGPNGTIEFIDGVLEDITDRKRIETELRESEAKYRELVDNALEGIWSVDREWNTSFVNRSMAGMLGYAPEEMVGRPLTTFMDQAGRSAIREFIARRERGMNEVHEFEFVRKDGTKVYARLAASALLDRQGRFTGGVALVSDITDRRKTEEALRQSEERFRSLIESAPVAIAISRNGVELYGNPSYLRMFGYEHLEEMIGHPLTERIAPGHRERTMEVALTNERGEAMKAEMETVGLRKDGTEFPFIAAVTRVSLHDGPALLGFFIDISDRKEMEETLRRSETFLQEIMDSASDAVFVKGRDGRMLMANPAYFKMMGKEPFEVLGKIVADYHDPEVAEAISSDERQVMESGISATIEERILTSSGWRTWHTTKAPFFAGEGHVVGYIGIARDVTERKRAEDELKSSKQMLQLVLDNVPDRVFWKDRDLIYLGGNRNAARDAGLANPQDIVGKDDYELAWRDSADSYRADDQQVIVSGRPKINFEEPQVQLDGSVRWLQTSKVPLRGPDGEIVGVLGTYEDITERKQAERALRESQEDLKHAQSVSHMGSWRLNVPINELVWSDETYRIFGIPRGTSMTYDAFLDTIYPDDRDYVDRKWQAAQRGEPYDIEHRIVARGEVRWVRERAELELDEQGVVKGGFGTVQDITERKKAEEALRESEERFRTLSEATFEGIVVHSDGVIIDVNKAALEQIGYGWEEVIGRPILEFFTADSQAVIREMVLQPMVKAYEAQLIRKDGELRTVRIQARVLEFEGRPARVATIIDITEQVNARRRIEELVARKEKERTRLRTILDTLPVGVLIADENAVMIEVNDIVMEIMGESMLLAKGIGDYSAYRGWYADSGIKLGAQDWGLTRAVTKGERVKGQVIDIERADGSRGTILDSGAPLKDTEGRIVGGVSVIQDITKQRELEHEAIEAKERAELYIDLLTHDINNMNAAAKGYLQLVEDDERLEGKERKRIQKCQAALDDISELIEKVKKIQQIEGPDARRGLLDLGWIIEDVTQSFKDYPGRDVTINYRPQLKRMVLASELLTDVFTNLIGNGIKHSSGPVTIDINISKIFDEGREYYMVTVEDNGPGIPDEAKKQVFSRLQRGKSRASGSGLGLFLVRTLVEDFRGRVWVEDRVAGDHAQGAKFVVMLPVAATPDSPIR